MNVTICVVAFWRGGGQLKIDRVTITPDNMEYAVHVWLGEETRVSVFRTWRLSWLSRENIAAAGLIWSTFCKREWVGSWKLCKSFMALVLMSRTLPLARAGQTQAAGAGRWKKKNTYILLQYRAGSRLPHTQTHTHWNCCSKSEIFFVSKSEL